MSAPQNVDDWVDTKMMPFSMLMTYQVAHELAKRVRKEGGPELITVVTRDARPSWVMHPALAATIQQWCTDVGQVAKYMPDLLDAVLAHAVELEPS